MLLFYWENVVRLARRSRDCCAAARSRRREEVLLAHASHTSKSTRRHLLCGFKKIFHHALCLLQPVLSYQQLRIALLDVV